MNEKEEAAITYNPSDGQTISIGVAIEEAEVKFSKISGVKGFGAGQSDDGKDLIVVYVSDTGSLKELPSSFQGFAIKGEVTGDIKIQ